MSWERAPGSFRLACSWTPWEPLACLCVLGVLCGWSERVGVNVARGRILVGGDGGPRRGRRRERAFTVVLSDQRMPDGEGLLLLEEVRKLDDPPEVILMTAYGSIDSAVQ